MKNEFLQRNQHVTELKKIIVDLKKQLSDKDELIEYLKLDIEALERENNAEG